MKRVGAFICFYFLFFLANAQVFKIKYLPGYTYKGNIKTITEMSMDILGDSATRNQAIAKGVKMPLKLESSREVDLEVKSGDMKTDGAFSLIFKFATMSTKQTINGEERPEKTNPFIGRPIYAEYSTGGKITIDSIGGDHLNEDVKLVLSKTVEAISSAVQFPEKPLKVGETFTQQVPVSFPIAGLNIKLSIKIVYKLSKIEGDLAFFDLDESANLDMSGDKESEQFSISGSGGGTGKMVYSISKQFDVSNITEQKFNLKFMANDLNMACTAKVKVIHTTEISSNQ